MNDQAEALRHMVRNQELRSEGRTTRVLTVTSGKGGVGKSNFSLNFALALSRIGKKVLIFDADISMANIDVLMGISSTYNLYHLLKQEKTIWEIIQEGPQGVHFIAGGSGFKDLLDLSASQLDYFAEQIGRLHGQYDVILFDTGAGLSKETVKFITAAQETIVVTTPEPTSITDAYALIKMVTAMEHDVNFKLIVNRAVDAREGRATADKIGLVARRFLELDIPVLGIMPDDPNVIKAVKKQVPFAIAYPGTDATRSIDEIARRFVEFPGSSVSVNHGVKGFLQRMFKRS
ncbi:MinD/ParA family protein [Paenibacillus glycinis]|uniref:P-loop NTPase n=1 Tax=Paenibacillus glycinis TaxID=2697035 RepID=A0ABW9XIK6_9BACL|nr:MinD/ParA family protein [Paenibacillus glycinis]NBD22450.1 P-loop NTPase [Paenibacillus glycinis]